MIRSVTKCKVSIFGEVYSLVTDEAEGEVLASAHRVDTLMRHISEASHITDPKRIAVLVALQLARQIVALETGLSTLIQQDHFVENGVEKT